VPHLPASPRNQSIVAVVKCHILVGGGSDDGAVCGGGGGGGAGCCSEVNILNEGCGSEYVAHRRGQQSVHCHCSGSWKKCNLQRS
jgi:hypothetical protein